MMRMSPSWTAGTSRSSRPKWQSRMVGWRWVGSYSQSSLQKSGVGPVRIWARVVKIPERDVPFFDWYTARFVMAIAMRFNLLAFFFLRFST